MHGDPADTLAVIVVTYRSADVIGPCLDSLLAVGWPTLDIVVVDNASPDDTVRRVRSRAPEAGRHRITLVQAPRNGGFAAGVNLGLARHSGARFVWILNPDCTVPPSTPAALLGAAHAAPGFALMGGRTLYARPPHPVQSDGGRVGLLTGVCRLVNRGADPGAVTPAPGTLDFISGASMLASRAFLDRAGPLDEGYFLYYEEVDWAARRGDLPLALCPGAIVYHQAGSAVGSPAPGRPATAFSNYFNYRSRVRFLARHRPVVLPLAVSFALARILGLALRGAFDEAGGALRGVLWLGPPRSVRRRLGGPSLCPPPARRVRA